MCTPRHRKCSSIWRGACLLVLTIAATRTHAQSFDCTKASTTIEAAICGDKSLGELDNTLARAFKEALSRAPDQQGKLIQDERRWLAHREQVCAQPVNGSSASLIACLTNVYMVRINQLSLIRADTPLTIPQACAVVRDYNDAKLEMKNEPSSRPSPVASTPGPSPPTPAATRTAGTKNK